MKSLIRWKAAAVVLQMNDVSFDGKYKTAFSSSLSSHILEYAHSPCLGMFIFFPSAVRGDWKQWVSKQTLMCAECWWYGSVACKGVNPFSVQVVTGNGCPGHGKPGQDEAMMLWFGKVSSPQHLQKNPGQAVRGVWCVWKWLPDGSDQVSGWGQREEPGPSSYKVKSRARGGRPFCFLLIHSIIFSAALFV